MFSVLLTTQELPVSRPTTTSTSIASERIDMATKLEIAAYRYQNAARRLAFCRAELREAEREINDAIQEMWLIEDREHDSDDRPQWWDDASYARVQGGDHFDYDLGRWIGFDEEME
jgi:exonuclease VII small subunit